ncbi:MAG: tetratricopeptide repeat protein [Pseudomonadota bacterium]|nr:tetratricopeptide repeat protein [Pseudomonadota bacterium]
MIPSIKSILIGNRQRLSGALALMLFPWCGYALDYCGSLDNPVGPYDYNDPQLRAERLPIVEQHHFYNAIETLTHPNPISDLDYTLRASPNHHRALYTIIKLDQRTKGRLGRLNRGVDWDQSVGRWPATLECYFDRAFRFRPKDPIVHMLYGIHLHNKGKLDEALERYKIVEKLSPKLPELHYNLGLLYVDRQEYDLAREHAKKAYALGYPLPGLRNKLTAANQWP